MIAKLKEKKILLVGVGGVGSEILKNLCIAGYENITIIDMDTIEVSNLNRQLMFRLENIGQSKVSAAKSFCDRINDGRSSLKITAKQQSILSEEFDVCWFKEFDIVVNALDNIEARKHVSKQCHLSRLPLIETGTGGYNGQCEIFNGDGCYECEAPSENRNIPVCTIRNEPQNTNHTLTWAKHVFKKLFCRSDDFTSMDIVGDEEMANEISKDTLLQTLFKKSGNEEFIKSLQESEAKTKTTVDMLEFDRFGLHKMDELIGLWKKSLSMLQGKTIEEWEKDDFYQMLFVYASANLRNICYDIQQVSFWKSKSLIGRIIPAIATSNAIVAGIAFLQLQNILGGQQCSIGYIRLQEYYAENTDIVRASKPSPRRVNCSGCKPFVDLEIRINFSMSLWELAENLFGALNIQSPTIIYNNDILLSSDYKEDVELHSLLKQSLAEMNLPRKMFWLISDEDTTSMNYGLLIEKDENIDNFLIQSSAKEHE